MEYAVPGIADMYLVPYDGRNLMVRAVSWEGWDWVSVALYDRCPTWDEMQAVKRLFFDDEETAMQLHPPQSKYRNELEFTLHIWRPHDREIPLPPVGDKPL